MMLAAGDEDMAGLVKVERILPAARGAVARTLESMMNRRQPLSEGNCCDCFDIETQV
jgi:hypothetical protein